MYKNMFNTKALPIAMSMALVSTSVVAVEISNHAGAICNNATASYIVPPINNTNILTFINTSDALYIYHSPNGTRSKKTSSVTCPLVRKTISTYGATMKVDINHYSTNATTRCTAYSYNPNGTLIVSNSAFAIGTGYLILSLNLYGIGNSTPLSYYSVYCSIPTNGIIHGIRLGEYDERDPKPE